MKSSKKKTSTERTRHHAKGRQVSASAPSPSSRRGEKKTAKVVAKPAYRAKATPRHTERKRHLAKPTPKPKSTPKKSPSNTERKRHPAKPSKVTKKASANTERKRHHAKSAPKTKPAKKAKTAKKSAPKTKPAKKVAKKGRSKDSASAPSPSSRRGEKKAAKVVAKPAYRAKATPRHTERKRHPAKKAKKETPKKVAKEKPSKSAKVAKSEKKAKKEKVKEKPTEFFRPPKRGATGALIISKRGRKSKKERAAAEAQSIFVPRDVKAENTEENQIRDARAYSPDELEQLLMSRGVSNMNVFDPKTASTAKVEYRAEAAPCHTERKRHLAKEKKQKKVILTALPKAKKRQTVGPVSVSDLFGFNPFAKNSASQEEKLIPEKWRKYYRKLIERKDALLARLNEHSEKAFQKEGKEETGDVSAYSQHTADIDSDAFDRDVALSRLPAEQEELSEINIAIDRMKKGTYGICEITGKPIPAERLNKVPFTRYSLEGKLEAEKQRGLAARRRRANATGDISEVIDLENDAPVQLPEEENEEQ